VRQCERQRTSAGLSRAHKFVLAEIVPVI
jgi:hypothetical protein